MTWRKLGLAALAGALAGCFGAPDPSQLFACSSAAECAEDMRCDDGVCCRVGGSPACPTLVPESNVCPSGDSPRVFYEDLDGDGFGNEARSLVLCGQPTQRPMTERPGDCNDNPAAAGTQFNPSQVDACTGADNNCNGVANDPPCANFYWHDEDGDGFGDSAAPLGELGAQVPERAVTNSSDCAPAIASIHPGAPETCDGVDENCNGIADDGSGEIRPFFRDGDFDGFGNPKDFVLACAPPPPEPGAPPSYVADSTDCNDRRSVAYPGAFDGCDGLDDDCDGVRDDPPDCGGQPDLLDTSTGKLTWGAQNNRVSGGSFRGCRRTGSTTYPVNPVAETFVPPSWSGTGLEEHVAWVETDTRWDLSRPNTVFRMDFSVTGTGLATTKPFFRDGVFERQPLIVFCDKDGNSNGYINLETVAGNNEPLIKSLGVSYSITIPVGGSPANSDINNKWLLVPRGLDIKNVKWVELIVQPNDVGASAAPTFTFNLTRLGFE